MSAESRAAALQRLERSLQEFPILGIATNVPFLLSLVRHPEVRASRIDTRFIERHVSGLTQKPTDLPPEVAAAFVTAREHAERPANVDSGQPAGPWVTLKDWRL